MSASMEAGIARSCTSLDAVSNTSSSDLLSITTLNQSRSKSSDAIMSRLLLLATPPEESRDPCPDSFIETTASDCHSAASIASSCSSHVPESSPTESERDVVGCATISHSWSQVLYPATVDSSPEASTSVIGRMRASSRGVSRPFRVYPGRADKQLKRSASDDGISTASKRLRVGTTSSSIRRLYPARSRPEAVKSPFAPTKRHLSSAAAWRQARKQMSRRSTATSVRSPKLSSPSRRMAPRSGSSASLSSASSASTLTSPGLLDEAGPSNKVVKRVEVEALPELRLLSATQTAPIGWSQACAAKPWDDPIECYDENGAALAPESQRFWPIRNHQLDYTAARMLKLAALCTSSPSSSSTDQAHDDPLASARTLRSPSLCAKSGMSCSFPHPPSSSVSTSSSLSSHREPVSPKSQPRPSPQSTLTAILRITKASSSASAPNKLRLSSSPSAKDYFNDWEYFCPAQPASSSRFGRESSF
ncbi:hypothetical protein BCV70DRAFT_35734 [Testicularia cyperi]|uniref:Uncharacterized protein n=1 Tax=Testicularia cyperi TaxID=1882483 RepID=A0A317XIS8_9BASI|nr:hypothetical protein BCV70DRAFT_35734 [Testicularia cyperi]